MRERSVLFWDFDGVIKESVEVKTRAYLDLFVPFGRELVERVRAHHEANGGMSRFEKIPLYLRWAGQHVTGAMVEAYCRSFAAAVRQAVVDSAWVPGAREYLTSNRNQQRFILVTATPQQEIEDILAAIGISACFSEIHGAPTPKASAIASVLARFSCAPDTALVIGDSSADYVAAQSTGVDFLLRRTGWNRALQREDHGPQCENFLHE